MNMLITSPEKNTSASTRPQSLYMPTTSRARSQTVGSQENDLPPPVTSRPLSHHKRQSQVFDVSPSSSDNEDQRTKALLRVQKRRQSSRRMSQIMPGDGPAFRALDVLICEDHPVSRLVMERLLEKLKCRTITVVNGPEAARYAMSEVQFDIIMMEYKLPQINGADVARMIRDTKSANTQTPIIAVTGYLKELPQSHHFDSLMEKPATVEKIIEALQNLCHWRPPPPGYSQYSQMHQQQAPQPYTTNQNIPSSLRRESRRLEESPSSQSSGPFSQVPGLRTRSSREHSIGSSFFGDTDSTNTEDIPLIVGRQSDEWSSNKGLGITETLAVQTPNDQAPQRKPSQESYHPGLPHLIHQNSAPPSLDIRILSKQRSAEAVRSKREDLQRARHESAESGDDEDEELGHVQVRARSPQGKTQQAAKRSSKLGIEMMRRNSRGSIDESAPPPQRPSPNPREERADQICAALSDITLNESPSAAATPTVATYDEPKSTNSQGDGHSAITPPELFPPNSGGDNAKEIDMDATPRPPVLGMGAASGSTVQEEDEEEDDIGLPIQMPQTPATGTFPRR